jgi:hypothetical protein
MPPRLFALVILYIGVLLDPVYVSHLAGMRYTSPHPTFYLWRCGLTQTFCTGWPRTVILLVATSQEVRITVWVTMPAKQSDNYVESIEDQAADGQTWWCYFWPTHLG